MAQEPGIVTVTLDGDEVPLRCTPAALAGLCRAYGDLRTVQLKVTSLDFDAMVNVVMLSSPAAEGLSRDAVEATVFDAGIINLVTPMTNFISLLANGGRPIEATTAKAGAKNG